ncbi:hypothetical protein [Ornithinimicrobium sediminis]|uniref:hypothetical protein n=1 Tax=Ornithinimicrobium sediminis TaxID=2904603 RepID=UPI001E2C84A2|nr:hypothetical protein [Ornithinimicrobium sediminis]MCE0485240.1 hypothetical protein [Ornithinimicrobium sediminis]
MFIPVVLVVATTAALAVVGQKSTPAAERTSLRSPRGIVASVRRGNAVLAAGPRAQYDRIAELAR